MNQIQDSDSQNIEINDVSLDISNISSNPDPITNQESRNNYIKEIQDRNLQNIDDAIKARKEYTKKIYNLIVIWLASIFVIILAQGFSSKDRTFYLSNSVFITLISGTTINVLGLFVIVINYFFKHHS